MTAQETTTTPAPTTELSPKARSLLEMESPLFDALWPTIFTVADPETQNALHHTSSYFKRMWEEADTHHKSDSAKSEYASLVAHHSYPKDAQLAGPVAEKLWYSWGAKEATFSVQSYFAEFCKLAGVDPESGKLVDPEDPDEGWVYLSEDKDLSFTTKNHPLNDDYGDGYVHEIGCTGEREKAIRLEQWWLENGGCAEMYRGTRYVNPITGQPV